MTATAVALALLPVLVTGTIAGQEVVHPIAVIVLGGLVTSTLVTLFVVPAAYLRVAARPAGREGS
jgi:Cu/Ag efflux pump CusA